jgi:hypothetical protein
MRRTLVIATFCALPVQALAAAAPPAAAAGICDFLKKVVATAMDGFWPLTAAPRNPNAGGDPLAGTLVPAANTRCFVVPAHTEETKRYAAEYSCEMIEFGSYSSVASLTLPEKAFDDTETKLRGCLSGVRSETHTEGRRGTNAYQRTLSWPQAGAVVQLRLAVVGGSPREPALIAVQLAVTDTSPAN